MTKYNRQQVSAVLNALFQDTGGGGGAPAPAPRNVNVDFSPLSNSSGGGGGGGGFSFGGLFGKFGQVLSYGLHTVTSSEKEIADAITQAVNPERAKANKTGTASWSDLWQQIVNPKRTINWGQVLGKEGVPESGVRGMNLPGPVAGIGGFAGDVLQDPLTYVGGVGLAKSGGKRLAEEIVQQGSRQLAKEGALAAGREGTANIVDIDRALNFARAGGSAKNTVGDVGKIVEAFKATPEGAKILEQTGTAASAARRGGISGLSKEQIAQFLTDANGKPIAQRGLGFGLGKHQVVIPGTGTGPLAKLGETYHDVLAKIGDVHYGSLSGKAFESARDLKIAARSADPEVARQATLTMLARATAHREGEHLAIKATKQLETALAPLSSEERALVPKALQGDTAALASLGTKHEPVAALLDQLGTKAQQAGLNINKLEDYFPRRIDPEAKKLLTEAGVISKKGTINGPTGFASEVARKLKPGDNEFLGVKFTAKTEAEVTQKAGEIARKKLAQIDPQMAEKFGEFFHGDPEKVLKGYIRGWSQRVAQANAAQHLYERGVGSALAREVVAAPGSKKAAGKLSKKLEGALATIGGTEARLTRAEAKSAEGQQKLEQALADIGPTPTAAAPGDAAAATAIPPTSTAVSPADVGPSISYTNTKADLADALLAKDVMGARESFAEIVKQSGVNDPRELARIVDQHFVEGPGGVLISDDKAIMRYVRNAEAERAAKLTDPSKLRYSDTVSETPVKGATRRREASQVSVANQGPEAVRMAQEPSAATLQDVTHLQEQSQHLDAILGSPHLPAAARTHLQEMKEAIDTGAKWGEVQASALAQADHRIKQIAVYERTAAKARQQLADLHQNALSYETKLEHVSNQTVDRVIGGMKDAAGLELRELRKGVGTPDQVARWLADSEQLITPESIRKGLKHWDSALGWIKDYQIAYPGFHIRNGMGGVFNNAEAGISTVSYGRLLGMWRRAAKGKLRESEVQLWEDIQKIVGHGQIGEESLFGRGTSLGGAGLGKKLNPFSRQNYLIQGSRWTGEQVEFFLRGSLALDTLKKGGTIDDAVQMVSKFHFDYSDLSKFEQSLRHVVPFYTWTRKNLPLQIEQLVKNPKWTARYFHAKTETEQLSSPDSIVPNYFGDLGAIRTPITRGGGHVYAAPDLPLRDLARFGGSPMDLPNEALQMVSPLIKTPLELKFGKQAFKNIPLRGDKFVPAPPIISAIPGVVPALNALKVFHGKGNVISEKDAYALEQAIPFIGRARRLFPKEDKYAARRMTTWLSLFGVGSRTNTTQEQQAARMTQGFAKSAARRRQKALDKAAGG